MDKQTYDNWKKIKETLEAAGKTDCQFYKRALVVLKFPAETAKDPFDPCS